VERLIAETTFLIDLEREARRREEGPASHFVESHGETELLITPVIAGELAAGVAVSERAQWEAFVRNFRILGHDETVSWFYGETYRYLKDQGLLIGSNDLWIAATARAYSIAIVTRNADHFQRVPGIEVVAY
jgi:predicted nucleic acid-binding protein